MGSVRVRVRVARAVAHHEACVVQAQQLLEAAQVAAVRRRAVAPHLVKGGVAR